MLSKTKHSDCFPCILNDVSAQPWWSKNDEYLLSAKYDGVHLYMRNILFARYNQETPRNIRNRFILLLDTQSREESSGICIRRKWSRKSEISRIIRVNCLLLHPRAWPLLLFLFSLSFSAAESLEIRRYTVITAKKEQRSESVCNRWKRSVTRSSEKWYTIYRKIYLLAQ